MRAPKRHVALTIAGSDSGGGAGIQADLKTFAALGLHGTSVITALTAQNPRAVIAVQALPPGFVQEQIRAVLEELPPRAAKTGMLFSADIIRAVAASWAGRRIPLVVDPVMVSTSGASLLQPEAIDALQAELLPRARLVTPNLDEARLLTGLELREPEDLRRAARQMQDRFGCAVLVKGGHLPGREAIDVLRDGREEMLLRAPRVKGVSSHGTGCTYSAAITGYLALGCALAQAVELAKTYITHALQQSPAVGRHRVLEHFWR